VRARVPALVEEEEEEGMLAPRAHLHRLIVTVCVGVLVLLALVVLAAPQGIIAVPNVIALVVGAPLVAILVCVLHCALPLALVHRWRGRQRNST
jgi:hypothetical protein